MRGNESSEEPGRVWGAQAAIGRDVNALRTLNWITNASTHCATAQTLEGPKNPKPKHRDDQVSFGKTEIRKHTHTHTHTRNAMFSF